MKEYGYRYKVIESSDSIFNTYEIIESPDSRLIKKMEYIISYDSIETTQERESRIKRETREDRLSKILNKII